MFTSDSENCVCIGNNRQGKVFAIQLATITF